MAEKNSLKVYVSGEARNQKLNLRKTWQSFKKTKPKLKSLKFSQDKCEIEKFLIVSRSV